MESSPLRKLKWSVIAVVILIAGLAWGFLAHSKTRETEVATETTREVALSCTTDMFTKFHIHPTVSITIDGTPLEVPANIGITSGCMHPIHTHDVTGTIHVESPVQKDFTLGDFFAVWDKKFSSTEFLDHMVVAPATLSVMVNGVLISTYENTILHDKDKIEIIYKSK